MNEFQQRQAAEAPRQDFTAEFPGARRRRILVGAVALFVVVVLVVGAVLFTGMNNRIHRLNRTTATQAQQIKHLQSSLNAVDASLGAAVACLQTVGSLEGLCSKLVK